MKALEKRYLKSRIINILEEQGFIATGTDSAEIAVFTDKPINNKSVKLGNFDVPWITSFGEKGAIKFIEKECY